MDGCCRSSRERAQEQGTAAPHSWPGTELSAGAPGLAGALCHVIWKSSCFAGLTQEPACGEGSRRSSRKACCAWKLLGAHTTTAFPRAQECHSETTTGGAQCPKPGHRRRGREEACSTEPIWRPSVARDSSSFCLAGQSRVWVALRHPLLPAVFSVVLARPWAGTLPPLPSTLDSRTFPAELFPNFLSCLQLTGEQMACR